MHDILAIGSCSRPAVYVHIYFYVYLVYLPYPGIVRCNRFTFSPRRD